MVDLVNKGQELNLTIRQGATVGPFMCTVKNSLNAPINILGYTFRAQIKKTPFSRKETGCVGVCTITNAANGQFSVEFSATDTALLKAGDTENDPDSQYVWDLEMQQPDGKILPVVYGTVKVFREVTKN